MLIENNKYIIKEESFLFSCNDKLRNLGYGEWVEECDKVLFEYMGYECMVHRAYLGEKKPNLFFSGHLCGYVKIHGKNFSEKKEQLRTVSCHYGITYDSFLPEHWIGFDCAHPGDLIPSIEMIIKTPKSIECTYRNIEFCKMQCISIVNQLIWIDQFNEKIFAKDSD